VGMKRRDDIERMRRGILRRLQIEYDYLHPGAQRRIDSALVRTRKYIKNLDSGVQARSPSGRARVKSTLVGKAETIADYIGGVPRGKLPVKKNTKKRKRVVGKK